MPLLPARQATLEATLTAPFTRVDAWPMSDALGVAIWDDASGRRVVIPGRLDTPERDAEPVSALLLTAPAAGDFTVTRLSDAQPTESTRMIDVDQSNESIVVDDDIVVKWQLLLADEPGPGADRMLTLAQSGFTDMPEPVLIARWRGQPIATATRFVASAEDGWDWAVRDVRAWAEGNGPEPVEPFARIGSICARMHRALAQEGTIAIDGDVLRQRALASLDEAKACATEDAALLDRLRPVMERAFDAMSGPTTAVAVHGDFHVGQILRAADGRLLVTDFDGNPVLSSAERRAPQPAARDVAGMLASIDHVGRVVIHRTEGIDPEPVLTWMADAQAAFLEAYRAEAADLLDERLLLPMRIEQECREFTYAARQLPHWRYVPAAALPALLEA